MSEKKKMRSSAPAAKRIVEHWTSCDGLLSLKSIEQRLGLENNKLTLKMINIEPDDPACMACGQIRGKWTSLERCHILGIDDALAGNLTASDISIVSNFVMMCRKCHVESPTSADTDTFWMWFAHKQTKQEEFMAMCRQLIDLFGEEIVTSAWCASAESPLYPVEGVISVSAMKASLLSNIVKIKKGEVPLVSIEEAHKKINQTLSRLKNDSDQDSKGEKK